MSDLASPDQLSELAQRHLLGEETPQRAASPPKVTVPNAIELMELILEADQLGVLSRPSVLPPLAITMSRRNRSCSVHSTHVAGLCATMAQLLEQPADQQVGWTVAGLVHELGEVAPPRKESQTRRERLKLPAQLAATKELMDACGVSEEFQGVVIDAHLRREPNGPHPESMSLGARVLALIDTFDTLLAETGDLKHTLCEMKNSMTHRLDDQLVEKFVDLAGRLPSGFHRMLPDQLKFELMLGIESADVRMDQRPAELDRPPVEQHTERPEPQIQVVERIVERPVERVVERPASLNASLELLGAALNQLDDGVCILDNNRRILFWNDASEQISGLSANQVLGQKWASQLLQGAGGTRDASVVERCLDNGQSLSEQAYIRRTDGGLAPVDCRAVPIQGGGSDLLGAAAIFHKMTSEHSVQTDYESLSPMAQHDPLTGLATRGSFDEMLAQLIQKQSGTRKRSSIIMADLDGFRAVNQRFGPDIGDTILKLFADLLVKCCQPSEIVARYGPEEFAVLLDGNGSAAVKMAERTRRELELLVLAELDGTHVTSSFGVAEFEEEDTVASFMGRADEALYQSKQHGGNHTELATGGLKRPWFRLGRPMRRVCTWLLASTGDTTAMKIHGFLEDYDAKVLELSPSRIRFRIGKKPSLFGRLRGKQSLPPLEAEINLARTHVSSQIHCRVLIRPRNSMRRETFNNACAALLKVLRSYLMADEASNQ